MLAVLCLIIFLLFLVCVFARSSCWQRFGSCEGYPWRHGVLHAADRRYLSEQLSDQTETTAQPRRTQTTAAARSPLLIPLCACCFCRCSGIDDSNTVRYLTNNVNSAVPFHAIHLNMHLMDPGTGQLIRNMSLDEFNYINNAEGTFTVTYRAPDSSSWALQVEINGEMIAHGKTYVVQGVDPLQLDPMQTAGMLAVSAIVSGVIALCFLLFVVKRSHPIQQSRSLFFDGMFTLGACVGTLAVLETTNYSHGTRVGEDLTLHADSHNPCQLYNVLLSLSMLLCYGALYGMVVRAYLIMESIKKSATAREEKKKSSIIHLTGELDSAAPPNAPLPLIPGMPTDVEIFAPVLLMIVIELVFQTVWLGVAPLRPTTAVAADNFRTYQICDGDSKRVWVYVDIGILGVMCVYLVMRTSVGRVVLDPLGEPRMITWVRTKYRTHATQERAGPQSKKQWLMVCSVCVSSSVRAFLRLLTTWLSRRLCAHC